MAGTLCLLTFNKKTWKWKWFSKRCKQGSQVSKKEGCPVNNLVITGDVIFSENPTTTLRAFTAQQRFQRCCVCMVLVAWGFGETGQFYIKTPWPKTLEEGFYHVSCKKVPRNSKFHLNVTEWRKERTVADTFSGDRFLNATPKKAAGSWVYWTWASVWYQPVW